jgi:glycine cleavage system aminomethyltransferase T
VVEGAPAREGADILDEKGKVIGKVTSGCPSPVLGKNIAKGYVREGWHGSKPEVGVLVRGKRRSGVVTKMPFVVSKYWKEVSVWDRDMIGISLCRDDRPTDLFLEYSNLQLIA